MRIELANCEATLLAEIAEPKATRKDIAKTYCLALRSSERERIGWAAVNRAIIDRWSFSALHWIKTQAWSGRCFGESEPDMDNLFAAADEARRQRLRALGWKDGIWGQPRTWQAPDGLVMTEAAAFAELDAKEEPQP